MSRWRSLILIVATFAALLASVAAATAGWTPYTVTQEDGFKGYGCGDRRGVVTVELKSGRLRKIQAVTPALGATLPVPQDSRQVSFDTVIRIVGITIDKEHRRVTFTAEGCDPTHPEPPSSRNAHLWFSEDVPFTVSYERYEDPYELVPCGNIFVSFTHAILSGSRIIGCKETRRVAKAWRDYQGNHHYCGQFCQPVHVRGYRCRVYFPDAASIQVTCKKGRRVVELIYGD